MEKPKRAKERREEGDDGGKRPPQQSEMKFEFRGRFYLQKVKENVLQEFTSWTNTMFEHPVRKSLSQL